MRLEINFNDAENNSNRGWSVKVWNDEKIVVYTTSIHRKLAKAINEADRWIAKQSKPTIAEAAIAVLLETNNPGVRWGDCSLLDSIARRAKIWRDDEYPLNRHRRILAALGRSSKFEKSVQHLKPGCSGNQYCRVFTLK